MVAGAMNRSSSSSSVHQTLFPRCHRLGRKRNFENMERFIPNRGATDFDYAHYMVTDGRKVKKNPSVLSPSSEAYRELLSQTFNMNRTHIFAYRNKPRPPVDYFPPGFSLCPDVKPVKPCRRIPEKAERVLDAPGIMEDFHTNLLDWGANNVVAIALGFSVYLLDESTRSILELIASDDESVPVTSVSWDPDGFRLAVGLGNSEVQLWDCAANKIVRVMKPRHWAGVGSLAWNNHILTTGGMDGLIINNDSRMQSHMVETYEGHDQEVCSLKWSASGQLLASGGSDQVLHIWDRSMASEWLHRLEDHTAAVRALAWCPFQRDLLASGGATGDECIKFWNTQTGGCLNSVNTGSQVCALLWNKHERELLSSHGLGSDRSKENQLTLWKYPSMIKMAELPGHDSRVLYMAQSPDGYRVASASGDETLRFWNIFGTPPTGNPSTRTKSMPFAHVNHIR